MLKLFKKPIWQQPKVVDAHSLQRQVFYDPARYKIVIAGRRFGKSILLDEECIKTAIEIPNAKCAIGAPTHSRVKNIHWNYIIKRLQYLKWIDKPEQIRSSETSITLNNGSKIFLKSFDNPASLIGEGYDFWGLDEFNSKYVPNMNSLFEIQLYPTLIDRKGRLFVISTPNGYDKLYELYMMGQNDSNNEKYDPDYKSWLFKTIDNPFIDKKEIDKARKNLSPQAFRQEFEASFESSSNAVYNEFNRTIHIKDLGLDKSLPLCLTFDFNVSYMTTSVCQIRDCIDSEIEQDKVVQVIKSIVTEQSNTQRQCDEIKYWLNTIDWQGEIYIYGDASGTSRKTSANLSGSDWEIVRNNFPQAYFNVPASNPPVRDRINAVNMKLKNAEGKIGIFINRNNCFSLIQDLEKVHYKGEAPNKSDEDKGLVHNSDNFGYLIHQEFPVESNTPIQFSFA